MDLEVPGRPATAAAFADDVGDRYAMPAVAYEYAERDSIVAAALVGGHCALQEPGDMHGGRAAVVLGGAGHRGERAWAACLPMRFQLCAVNRVSTARACGAEGGGSPARGQGGSGDAASGAERRRDAPVRASASTSAWAAICGGAATGDAEQPVHCAPAQARRAARSASTPRRFSRESGSARGVQRVMRAAAALRGVRT